MRSGHSQSRGKSSALNKALFISVSANVGKFRMKHLRHVTILMKPLRYLVALVIGLMITNAVSRGQEKRLPTLFIIGDSTVKNSGKGLLGWGDPIANFFDQTKIKIENRSRGGRWSRTVVNGGPLEQAVGQLLPRAFFLI